MESKQQDLQIANLMTNSELSFEICKEASDSGLILRYDAIKYRDQEIYFLSDVSGVQCVAQWNGQLVDLGISNHHYREDMCNFVDRQLDLISDFRNCSDFTGAKLEYFRNGNFRDIRLVYRGRTLKVFLVADTVNETYLISESEKILRTSGLLEDTSF